MAVPQLPDRVAAPQSFASLDSHTAALDAVELIGQMRRCTLASIAAAILLLLALVPVLAPGSFSLDRYAVSVAYVLAAIGLNLALGYAGELVIGYSAIMAVSAYSAGMLSALGGWAGVPTFLAATLVGTGFGVVTTLPGLRVQGWYLALISMFSVLVIPQLVILGEAWTGGEYGLTGIKAFDIFGVQLGSAALYELIVVVFGVTWLLQANFLRAGWGLRLRAIRDARGAAESVGIPIARTRAIVYLLGTIPPAMAGVLLAYSQRFVNYDSFNMNLTLLLLTGVVLGGSGRLWGPLVGMTPLLVLSFWVGPFSQYNAVILGFGLLAGVLAFPDGLVPAMETLARKLFPSLFVSRTPDGEEQDSAPRPPRAPRAASASAVVQDAQPVLISASGIRKRFGGLQALDGVDFELRQGRLCGLVGPNGSGKSTFLNTLSGFVRPDEGTIRVGKVDIGTLAPQQIAAAGIGRTFQVPQLIDELSALENIELALLAHEPLPVVGSMLATRSVRERTRSRRFRAAAVVARVGLPPRAIGEPVEKLSLGLKRIVEVARAIVAKPQVLLLDEPAAGLNDAEREALGALLRDIANEGMTILVVEHNVNFILTICDEIVLLESGAVRAHADLREELPERVARYFAGGMEPDRLKPVREKSA